MKVIIVKALTVSLLFCISCRIVASDLQIKYLSYDTPGVPTCHPIPRPEITIDMIKKRPPINAEEREKNPHDPYLKEYDELVWAGGRPWGVTPQGETFSSFFARVDPTEITSSSLTSEVMIRQIPYDYMNLKCYSISHVCKYKIEGNSEGKRAILNVVAATPPYHIWKQ
jgi:hypothetical protein